MTTSKIKRITVVNSSNRERYEVGDKIGGNLIEEIIKCSRGDDEGMRIYYVIGKDEKALFSIENCSVIVEYFN